MKLRLVLDVNGDDHEVVVAPQRTLLEVLREDLGLTGTKHGCELGECGTCTVLVDGEPYLSCLGLPADLEGRSIETVEGMARGSWPHELQVAFVEVGAAQCGYCTPGFLLSARSLLRTEPDPERDHTREWLAGNLCRCTGYLQILEAVELAAARIRARRTAGDPDPEHRRRDATGRLEEPPPVGGRGAEGAPPAGSRGAEGPPAVGSRRVEEPPAVATGAPDTTDPAGAGSGAGEADR